MEKSHTISREFPLLEAEPSFTDSTFEDLGAVALELAELDTPEELWKPHPNRESFLKDVFTAKVFDLDLTVSESALLMAVISDEMTEMASNPRGHKSTLDLGFRINAVGHYMEGGEAKELAKQTRVAVNIIHNIPSQFRQRSIQGGINNILFRRLQERLATERGEEFDPYNAIISHKEAMPDFDSIDLKEGSILSNREVAASLVHLLKLDQEHYGQLAEFFSPESVEKNLVVKDLQYQSVFELRAALTKRIKLFSKLANFKNTNHALVVRRILGGELDTEPGAVIPHAVYDLTFSRGGRNYELVQKAEDALSAFVIALNKRFTPVKRA